MVRSSTVPIVPQFLQFAVLKDTEILHPFGFVHCLSLSPLGRRVDRVPLGVHVHNVRHFMPTCEESLFRNNHDLSISNIAVIG